MALSQELLSQFAKLTNNENKVDSISVKGTYKKINGIEYVQLDGSDILTPVTSTVEAETGERVTVTIKDHNATVTGNISSPSARTKSVEDLKDEVDEHGNTIKQLDNSIEQQGNSIIQIENNINQQQNTINQHGNLINQQNDRIISIGNDVIAQNNKIEALDNDITLQGNVIDSMNNTITEHGNTINSMNNTISQQGNVISQQGNTISQQGNTITQQGNSITEINSNVTILNSGFVIDKGVITGLSGAVIGDLEANNLDARYANINFTNIQIAAIATLFTESGIIKDLIVSGQKITGELVGVTIKGDLIEGNSIVADKLVVKGEDGIYYKLNIDGMNNISTTEASKFTRLSSKPDDWTTNYKDYYLVSSGKYVHVTGNSAPNFTSNTYYKLNSTYENALDGSNIVAHSIVAEKIAVDDLVAFGATIGGFDINTHSLHTHLKDNINSPISGMFMDDSGQVTFGDNQNYIKYYKDGNKWKLDLMANEISMGSSGKTIKEEIQEVENKAVAAKTSADNITTRVDNKESHYNFKYYTDVTVYGDQNKFYPVIIKAGDQNVKRTILVKRGYSEKAPAEWNKSTHPGSLTLKILCNFGGWGGANYSWEISELEEMYSHIFGGAANCGNYTMFAIFLRGGGTNGAIYHLYSDQSLTANIYNYGWDDTLQKYVANKLPAPQISYRTNYVQYKSDLCFGTPGNKTPDAQGRYDDLQYKVDAPAPRDMVDSGAKTEGGFVKYIRSSSIDEEIRIRKYIKLAQDNDTLLKKTVDQTSEVVVGTQTAATGSWTGIASLSSLKDKQQITYWLPYAGSGNATLTLTLSNGSKTEAIPCYYSGTTRLTTHYAAGNVVHLTYRENVTIGTTTIAKGWWADANYNTNDNTYDRIRYNNNIKAKTAIAASTLIVGDSSGYFKLVAGSIFDIDKPILWAGSAIAAAATGSNNYLSMPSCTMRNNTTSVWVATQYETLYLVGKLEGQKFTADSTTFLTTTKPTTNDGKYYIALGYMYSTYQIYLYPEHPIYAYVNDEFKNISQIAYEAQYNIDKTRDDLSEEIDTKTGSVQSNVDKINDHFSDRVLDMIRNTDDSSFVLTTSQPNSWATNYKNYYRFDANSHKYIRVDDDTVPTWSANTFYSCNKTLLEMVQTISDGRFDLKWSSDATKEQLRDSVQNIIGMDNINTLKYISAKDGVMLFGDKSSPYKLLIDNDGVDILYQNNRMSFWDTQRFDVGSLSMGNKNGVWRETIYDLYTGTFTALTSQPSSWSTNYKNYYRKSTEYMYKNTQSVYYKVAGSSAPTFVSGEFYSVSGTPSKVATKYKYYRFMYQPNTNGSLSFRRVETYVIEEVSN